MKGIMVQPMMKPRRGTSDCSEGNSGPRVSPSDARPVPELGQRKLMNEGQNSDGSNDTIISLPYKKHLMTSTEMSRTRHIRAAARKQEICSKNRTNAKGTEKPEAKAMSDSKDDSDFDGMSVHSNSSDDTAFDDDGWMFIMYLSLLTRSSWGRESCLESYCWINEFCVAQDPQFKCPSM
jgi:hypothetical protein